MIPWRTATKESFGALHPLFVVHRRRRVEGKEITKRNTVCEIISARMQELHIIALLSVSARAAAPDNAVARSSVFHLFRGVSGPWADYQVDHQKTPPEIDPHNVQEKNMTGGFKSPHRTDRWNILFGAIPRGLCPLLRGPKRQREMET